MNCIIVDDDEMSRSTVQHFVEQTEFLKLKGNCSSAAEAIQILKTEHIELVFLDIEMPHMSGLEMLETLEHNPYIIFITSKRDYAVEAFEHNVVDYLLKPLKYVRFIKAVNKVLDLKKLANTTTYDITDEDIFVKSELKYVRIRFKEVHYIEAMADYVVLYLKDSKHIIHSTMKGIEKKVPLDSYVRVHRSYIVNLTKIELVENANVVVNGKRIPIGASYKNEFMSRLKIL
jgi:DNA-binding LytR/AlgR family response regulator